MGFASCIWFLDNFVVLGQLQCIKSVGFAKLSCIDTFGMDFFKNCQSTKYIKKYLKNQTISQRFNFFDFLTVFASTDTQSRL